MLTNLGILCVQFSAVSYFHDFGQSSPQSITNSFITPKHDAENMVML